MLKKVAAVVVVLVEEGFVNKKQGLVMVIRLTSHPGVSGQKRFSYRGDGEVHGGKRV